MGRVRADRHSKDDECALPLSCLLVAPPEEDGCEVGKEGLGAARTMRMGWGWWVIDAAAALVVVVVVKVAGE